MDFFRAKSPEEVTALLTRYAKGFSAKTKLVTLHEALGRVLSEDIISDQDIPGFDRSTVDGYAVIASDTFGATGSIPTLLDFIGEVKMGNITDKSVEGGTCVYVPTGGMMPAGATAMVMIEDTEKIDGETVAVEKPVVEGANIIFKGDDMKAGLPVLEKGRILNANDIGVLSALGIGQVSIVEPVKATVYSTGDEIISVDAELKPGQIRDINGNVVKAMLNELGVVVVRHRIIEDTYEVLFEAVEKALADSDIVLLSGGSSVGVRDYTHQVIEAFDDGHVDVHGIMIKPGKPTIIGRVGSKTVIGLPGHPVSSIMVYKAFVEPMLLEMSGKKLESKTVTGTLSVNLHGAPGKRTYQMVRFKDGEEVVPFYGKSGMISLIAGADGYIVIGNDQEGLNKGTEVEVHLF